MGVNPLIDSPNHRADYDYDYDDHKGLEIKKEIVEEEEKKQKGKRKYHIGVKDKKKKKKKQQQLSPSKSQKHGTPHSAGKGNFVSCNLEKTETNGITGPGQGESPATIRAQHVRLSLGTESPSFSKLLVRSHIDSTSMRLPISFCREHLPMEDTIIVLEDENEEQFEVKYCTKWKGVSAGWKNFVARNKLRERDVLVFHLVAPSKFKVYVIRANDSSEVDGSPSLLIADAHAKQYEPGENLGSDDDEEKPTTALKMKKMKSMKSLSQTTVQKKNKRALLEYRVEQSENSSEEVSLEFSEHSKSSEPTNGLETLQDFHIIINGLCVESELHENMRKKYYELCCSKNSILHYRLLPSLNSKLVAGIITETVNIADGIKSCIFATSQDELEQWVKSLISFELLGMNVGFLLNRLSHFLRLESEQARFEEEIKSLEVKRVELKEAYEKIKADIEKLKTKAERQHLKFGEVGTPGSEGKGKFVSPRQVKSPAMVRAEDIRSSLGTELPSFLKLVVSSHVEGSFSMSLPGSFCRSHLPINNTVIVLEDESEERFEVKYFPKWTGLSGGWRNFAVQHKLREGDVLVFHLVAPTRFKVYIVRANDSSEIDGTPRSHLDLDTHAKQNEPGENLDYDDNEDTDLCKGLETIKDFNIMLNGLGLEYSDLHENMRKKYYELCCSTNAVLHDGLLPGLNSKLIGGVISGTVIIADAIKACNFATSRDDLEQWEKSLKSFELLGMNVGFLLNRLSQLLRLVFESKRAHFEDEIKNLEVKHVELKEAYEKIGGDIEKMKSKAERQHLKLRELVNAPW